MITPGYINAEMAKDFEESVRLGAEVGVHIVCIRSGIAGKSVSDITEDDAKQMMDILAKYGSRTGVILPPCGKCDIDDQAKVKRHLEIFSQMAKVAHAFDTRLIRAFPFQSPAYKEYDPSHLDKRLDLIVKRLTPMVEVAEGEGVVMCLECVGSTLARTGQEIGRVVDALGSPSSVGVIWEINVACDAGELPTEGYEFVRGVVKDIHIKPNSHHRIDPAADSTDTYEKAFSSLLADGYEGPATIEHWRGTEGILSGLDQLKTILGRIQ